MQEDLNKKKAIEMSVGWIPTDGAFKVWVGMCAFVNVTWTFWGCAGMNLLKKKSKYQIQQCWSFPLATEIS